MSEGGKLRNAYQKSKLLRLKGQINPHFLFNCFNTLSGLIAEDEEKAEKFLNEMTKMHCFLRTITQLPVWEDLQTIMLQAKNQIQQQMKPAMFSDAWNKGEAMNLDQMVQFAMEG